MERKKRKPPGFQIRGIDQAVDMAERLAGDLSEFYGGAPYGSPPRDTTDHPIAGIVNSKFLHSFDKPLYVEWRIFHGAGYFVLFLHPKEIYKQTFLFIISFQTEMMQRLF